MWIAIFGAVFLATITGIIYLVTRFRKFYVVRKITHEKKKMQLLAGILCVVLLSGVLYLTVGTWNLMIVLIHLMLIWLICDGIAKLIHKLSKRENGSKYYWTGVAAITATVLYLGAGWFFAHHVYETDYSMVTSKQMGTDTLRIVAFADSHVGTTFDGEDLFTYVEEMNSHHPDVVFIVGDFVDDDTMKENMETACKAVGNLRANYGVYYVFGNHDRGYYGREHRGYGEEELVAELEKNGVTVLKDNVVKIAENICIVGRDDKSREDRASVEELMKQASSEDYVIVLDHQPTDYENEARKDIDLVLSGHTHGGQFIPINGFGEWFHINDRTYGYERRDVTDFIVTSGISNWAMKFKTGCISEYLVIDVKKS